MKQYTTPEQTAKLIEMGLPKPRCATMFWRDNKEVTEINYTFGELIEMLPKEFDGKLLEIAAVTLSRYKWAVRYPYGIIIYKAELIDALYEMIIKLKEEGVI